MTSFNISNGTAADERRRIADLRNERALVLAASQGGDAYQLHCLDAEITAAQHLYVSLAVTEIATLRGELDGRRQG